jgi:hypothetical protein
VIKHNKTKALRIKISVMKQNESEGSEGTKTPTFSNPG